MRLVETVFRLHWLRILRNNCLKGVSRESYWFHEVYPLKVESRIPEIVGGNFRELVKTAKLELRIYDIACRSSEHVRRVFYDGGFSFCGIYLDL